MRRMCILQETQQRSRRGLRGQRNGGRTDKDLALYMFRISILVGVALTIGKLSASALVHSNAMIPDVVHSAPDVFSTLVTMAGVTMAMKQSDKEHPFGHEWMGCVATLFLAVVLLAIGAGIGSEAVRTIFRNYGIAAVLGFLAMAAALVSIGAKEWMYRYMKKAASKIHPGALMADAWYHRSDALSLIGVLVRIGGMHLGIPLMDSVASLVICIFIGEAVPDVLGGSLNQMVDKTCGGETSDSIRVVALRSNGVERVDGPKTRLFGPRVYAKIKIAVDRNMKLEQVHHVTKNIHDAVEEKFLQVEHCLVQVNPLSGEEGGERLI